MPNARDLEQAITAQVFFAKRVMVTDPRHAEFHHEIDLLLCEWEAEKFRARGLTLIQPGW